MKKKITKDPSVTEHRLPIKNIKMATALMSSTAVLYN